jgi:hypothetical protein
VRQPHTGAGGPHARLERRRVGPFGHSLATRPAPSLDLARVQPDLKFRRGAFERSSASVVSPPTAFDPVATMGLAASGI